MKPSAGFSLGTATEIDGFPPGRSAACGRFPQTEIDFFRADFDLIEAELNIRAQQETGVPVTPENFVLTDAIKNNIQAQIAEALGQFRQGELRSGRQAHMSLPPRPPREGARKLGSRQHIGGTIDSELLKRIDQEKRKRGLTTSEMLDAMAWHFFDKPKLSFELEGEYVERPTKPRPGRQNARQLTPEEAKRANLPIDAWIAVTEDGLIELLQLDENCGLKYEPLTAQLRLRTYPSRCLPNGGHLDDRVEKLIYYWMHGE